MTIADAGITTVETGLVAPAANPSGASVDQVGLDQPGLEQTGHQSLEPTMFERVAKRVADRPDAPIDTSWRDRASCRDTDPDLFFPIGTTGLAITQIEEAKTVCMGCPAQLQCLEFALRANQDSGVWGGSSEEERRNLRRRFLSRRRSQL